LEDPPAEQVGQLVGQGPPNVLGRNDEFIRLVIGELLEGAARLNLAWSRAVALKDTRPEKALTELANVLPWLEISLPIEASDIATVIDRALDELEAISEAAHPTGEDGQPLSG